MPIKKISCVKPLIIAVLLVIQLVSPLTDNFPLNAQTVKKKPTPTRTPMTSPASKSATAEPEKKGQIGTVAAQARYALVIGNNNYPGRELTNPVNDARRIAQSLRAVGFKVTLRENLKSAEMNEAIEAFSAGLPQNAVGLFYYAGHGAQVSGKNFLLPVDFGEIKKPEDFLREMVNLDTVVAAVSKKSGLSIIILDACRNNPTTLALPVAAAEGFVALKQSAGIYIAYSTSPGTTASDGDGPNSPYSEALARNLLLNPGRLEDVFIKTRVEVINATSKNSEAPQIPWENGALNSLFYLTPDKLMGSVTTKPVAAVIKPKLPSGIKALQPFSFSVPELTKTGARRNLGNASASFYSDNLGAANLEMVEIRGGKFLMGSDATEVDIAFADAQTYNDEVSREVLTAEMPQHLVNVPGFFMGKYEVTQAQWRAVMGDLPDIPDNFRGDNLPVVGVGWKEANQFCDQLSTMTGRNYRLPSEAEWEYAAKAGGESRFGFGENINANFVNFAGIFPFENGQKGEYREKTTPVGQFKVANNFGLFDMQGNIWEWTADYWHDDYNNAPTDGNAWDDAQADHEVERVVRGGSWESIANNCRSTSRRPQPAAQFGATSLGFRVVAN